MALAALAAAAKSVATIMSAWRKMRNGRKVRVEFFPDGTPKKIEAATDDGIVSIFKAVQSETKPKPNKKTK